MSQDNVKISLKEKIGSEIIHDPDLKYLMENEVRFAIISALNLFREPLNLSKLSKITAYPITTLIHHIPSLLEKDLIVNSKVPQKRGKFYYLSDKTEKLLAVSDNEPNSQQFFDNIEKAKNMSIEEYQSHLKEYYQVMVESQSLDESTSNALLSIAIFNKNITNFTNNFIQKIILKIKRGETINFDLPLGFISNSLFSFAFSSVLQVKEFQKIFFTFYNDLIEFKQKIDNENKIGKQKILETNYLYLSMSPVINIEEFD